MTAAAVEAKKKRKRHNSKGKDGGDGRETAATPGAPLPSLCVDNCCCSVSMITSTAAAIASAADARGLVP